MKSLMPQIDSNDGLFHNGNPATGEQGTRVTDTWLNNLQDRVRDVQAEAHYVLGKAGFRPVENKQTQLYEAIVKIIDDNRKTASLTQTGEVQLSSSTNSNSETQAATSKAVKTAYDLANSKQSPATTLAGYGIGNFKIENFVGNVNTLQTDGIYAVTQASRSQNLPVAGNGCHIQVIAGGDGRWCRQIAYIAYSTDMYERHQTSYQTDSWSGWVKIDSLDKIPNSKKSSAVNSESEDHVATSKAVKTAYDKGVDAKTAADNAQSLANDANNNANGRILKTDISHVIDGSNKAKVASEFALGELNKKFTLSENLSETGWCKLPNGMILQWGSGTSQSSESGALFKFPLAFTRQCFSILATDVGGGTFAYGISPVNNAEFKVWSREIVRGKLAAGIFRWLAVGV